MANGHIIWAIAAWSFIPIGIFVAFWDILPSWRRVALALYLTMALSIVGTSFYWSATTLQLRTDIPDIQGFIDNAVIALRTDGNTDIFLQVSMTNRGAPSFVSAYRMAIRLPDGTLGAENIYPAEIKPTDPADPRRAAAMMRKLLITPANALDRKTLEPVSTRLIQGWLGFAIGCVPFDVTAPGTQLELRYADILGAEYRAVWQGSKLVSIDDNLQLGSCPGLER